MKTYNDLYLENRNILRSAGFENYQQEAKLLLAGASNKTVASLLSALNLYSSDEIESRNAEYIKRRLKNEPIAYILNSWEFYGLNFYVDSSVLIPRIDTETLIDSAREIFPEASEIRILDLCSGSGNIACTLAFKYPNSDVVAIDNSKKAVNVSHKNASSLHLASRVKCIQSDVMKTPPIGLGLFDLIISNPPYIKSGEIKDLEPSVRKYEPVSALDGGKSGYDFYESIINKWSICLKPDGIFIFEVGEEQADYVCKLLTSHDFKTVYTRKDTIGVERVVIGLKNNLKGNKNNGREEESTDSRKEY